MNEQRKEASGDAGQQSDAISMLLADHRKVLKMFDDFARMCNDPNAAEDAKQDLVDLACSELTLHTQLEQDIVYPALRASIENDLLIEQAMVEHQSATQIIHDLQRMRAGDEMYDAKFLVLSNYIRQHIEDEQDKIFPQAEKAQLDLDALGAQMLQRKQELQKEMGIAKNGEGRGAAIPQQAQRESGRAGNSKS